MYALILYFLPSAAVSSSFNSIPKKRLSFKTKIIVFLLYIPTSAGDGTIPKKHTIAQQINRIQQTRNA